MTECQIGENVKFELHTWFYGGQIISVIVFRDKVIGLLYRKIRDDFVTHATKFYLHLYDDDYIQGMTYDEAIKMITEYVGRIVDDRESLERAKDLHIEILVNDLKKSLAKSEQLERDNHLLSDQLRKLENPEANDGLSN
jgi:hypothetical protein